MSETVPAVDRSAPAREPPEFCEIMSWGKTNEPATCWHHSGNGDWPGFGAAKERDTPADVCRGVDQKGYRSRASRDTTSEPGHRHGRECFGPVLYPVGVERKGLSDIGAGDSSGSRRF